MSPGFPPDPIGELEIIEGEMLRIDEIARLCSVSVDWVLGHVHGETLLAEWREGVCYLSSAALWRARQIASIESRFEADPQLAALVVDLMDEVRELRARLALYER
jgi:chaperone modulatory protein CbpM